jgi:hypothetical protein
MLKLNMTATRESASLRLLRWVQGGGSVCEETRVSLGQANGALKLEN